MKKLYAHQQRFIDKNPNRALLVWETGTGKTVAACEWVKKRKGRALVVCPKGIVEKWKRDLKEWGVKADVVSRDTVKKTNITPYSILVLDEAQDFASPLFEKGRSQRATVIYTAIKNNPKMHVLLLTATPIRSTPYNIHTLACYLGIYWPVKEFRDKFFHLTNKFGRMHYEKNKGWQKAIRPYVEEISDIVLARDCADIPPQREHVVTVPWDTKQEEELKQRYLEPAAEWHERHRAENGKKKFDAVMRIANGYRKAIIVVYYRSQIEEMEKEIGEDRQVFVLHGGVKDQDAVIQAARDADDCIFILQASMGAGFDASEFSVMIFASMSFKFVDHIQSLGRIKRLNNLHENDYYYVLGGKCDISVHRTIMAGNDFHPPHYMLARQ